jgi:hypothetical protein
MRRSLFLDGGGTVAADEKGRVVVAWHALPEGETPGESHRRMLVARSSDDGATFTPESACVSARTGACACCGTRAFASAGGALHLLFRTATGGTDRDMMLLTSRDQGEHFESLRLHSWKATMCPMSSASLAEGRDGVLAAWETQGQVYFARIDPQDGRPVIPIHPRGAGGIRKHPAIAINAKGEIALAWAEDTTFQRGGSLAWRVFDPSGKNTDLSGRVEGGIPASSLPTIVAHPNGKFVIVH